MDYGDFSNTKGGYNNNQPKTVTTFNVTPEEIEKFPPKYNGSIIFFVNGHSGRITKPLFGGILYWKAFNDDMTIFPKAADYFKIKNGLEIRFVDGGSLIAIDSSGQDRKEAGHSFAEEHFINFKDILLTNQVFFVSHSEGCAFATGMAQYFVKNNINVVESVLLSCDEGDEFEIDFKLVCYQIECMYWETYRRGPVFIPRFDWIINTNLKKGGVKGVTKFGVVINNNLDALSIHGKGIVVPEIFSDIADLKEVQVLEKIKKNGGVYFEQTLKRAKFYQINDKVILSNHPDWNRIRKQSVNI